MEVLKDATRALLQAIDAAVAGLAAHERVPREAASVFIVGGPRSGSTLLYQALLRCRGFAYINNAVARFPRSAEIMARWLRVGWWPTPTSFSSDYGDTKGWNGLSEAGEVWDRVFPWNRHHSVEAEELTRTQIERIRKLVGGISDAYGAPFLCKNLWHSVRLEAIDRALPNSVFLVSARAPLPMARSILAGRREAIGDDAGFWSIRPRELLAFEAASPPEHVVQQLLLTYRAIDAARESLGPERFFDVPYEAFCAAPDNWIDRIDVFLARHGITAVPRGRIDKAFVQRDPIELPDPERECFLELLPDSLLSGK